MNKIRLDDISISYDSCGNTAVVILEINGIYIPLCQQCLNELKDIIVLEDE